MKSKPILRLTCCFVLLAFLALPDQPPTFRDESPASGPGFNDPAIKGPEIMRRYLAELHQPYGDVLPPGRLEEAWQEVRNLPAAVDKRSDPGWELVGPSGIQTPTGGLFSGRVLDIDALNGPGTMVAAASGGLWGYDFLFPSPLSDDVTCQWIGCFAVDPADENTILLGTGELFVYPGSSLWKSTDGGQTWVNKTIFPHPTVINRIRYGIDGQVVHMATEMGYYRSTDGGETWQHTHFGIMTDLAPSAAGPNTLWATAVDQGLLVTLNAGQSWVSVFDPVLPTDVHRGSVSVCAADPSVIYVAFSHIDSEDHIVMEGIYKTTDDGYTWSDVSPPVNYMGAQGWYNNVIAVSPTDPDVVLAGGVTLLRTTDGGMTWPEVVDDQLHVDYHAMQWHPNGLSVWAGHDGGWSYSQASGQAGSWVSDSNYLPITQFYHLDVAGIDWQSTILGGGTQDNAVPVTYDAGTTWTYRLGGDGSDFLISPLDWETLFATFGYVTPGVCFPRMTSSNGGESWTPINSGLATPGSWFPVIRIDGDYRLYTNNGPYVHSTMYDDGVWTIENPGPFDADVREVTVSPVSEERVIYACLDSDAFRTRLMVKASQYWSERSNGLPPNVRVRKVVPHPTDSYRVYALMNGYSTSGAGKIFLSTNRGLGWTDITGDLPNVPLTDLVIHPDENDRLYVSSEFGFFRTLDGGASWHRYNLGIPAAVMVTEMKTLSLRYWDDGGFYIVAGTFGRSIWKRNILLSDPTGAAADPPRLTTLVIRNAAPNPFNARTTIAFDLAVSATVDAGIYDLAGKRVRHVLDEGRPAGANRVGWDGLDDLGRAAPAGVYLVKIEAAGEVATRKITLAK